MSSTVVDLASLVPLYEAARELGVTSQRVRQLVIAGRLAAVRTPYGQLVERESLDRLREQRGLAGQRQGL